MQSLSISAQNKLIQKEKMRFFYKQLLYFKLVFKEMKQIEGYNYREVGNLPIVGCDHFKGYEIINPKTNKVLYRK